MAGFSYLHLADPPLPRWHRIPYATMMLIGGAVLGIAMSVCCRFFAASGANRRARLVAKAVDRNAAAREDGGTAFLRGESFNRSIPRSI